MNKDQLFKILSDWKKASHKEESKFKAKFTHLVNQWGKQYDRALVRGVVIAAVEEFCSLDPKDGWFLTFVRYRLTPGTLFQERGRVFGWIDADHQVQAIPLPLQMIWWNSHSVVCFYGFHKEEQQWIDRGFQVAEEIPLQQWHSHKQVVRSLDLPDFPHLRYERAVDLPYEWDKEEQKLTVTLNYKDLGFWNAWKIWEGCLDWYRDRQPDGFIDPNKLPPELDSAVLGGQQLQPQPFDVVLGGGSPS